MTNPEDLQQLLTQMGSMQAHLEQARRVTATAEVEGSAGQGAVRVRATGEFEFTAVTIEPGLVAGGDAELLEDLVLAAVRDAVARLTALQHAALEGAAGDAIAQLLGSKPPDSNPPA